jgi:exonuclease III
VNTSRNGDNIDLTHTETNKTNGTFVNMLTHNVQTLTYANIKENSTTKWRPTDKLPFYINEWVYSNISVAGLQEVRWCGNGETERTDLVSNKSFTIFHSGHETKAINGVAIAIKQEWVSGIEYKRFISDRIIIVAGVFDGISTIFCSVYAPTMDTVDELKDAFYNELQSELDKVPKKYTRRVFFGDWYARIGRDCDKEWGDIRGSYSISDELNSNGLRLLDFCRFNNLYISNTFKKSLSKKRGSWFHSSSNNYYTIDYILVSVEQKSNILKCDINEL